MNGVNNPCPNGYRLPTESEWNAERQSWNSNNAVGAFASPLKLPVAGYRHFTYNANIYTVGINGIYWSSNVNGQDEARYLYFFSGGASTNSFYRAYGSSVRCIRN